LRIHFFFLTFAFLSYIVTRILKFFTLFGVVVGGKGIECTKLAEAIIVFIFIDGTQHDETAWKQSDDEF